MISNADVMTKIFRQYKKDPEPKAIADSVLRAICDDLGGTGLLYKHLALNPEELFPRFMKTDGKDIIHPLFTLSPSDRPSPDNIMRFNAEERNWLPVMFASCFVPPDPDDIPSGEAADANDLMYILEAFEVSSAIIENHKEFRHKSDRHPVRNFKTDYPINTEKEVREAENDYEFMVKYLKSLWYSPYCLRSWVPEFPEAVRIVCENNLHAMLAFVGHIYDICDNMGFVANEIRCSCLPNKSIRSIGCNLEMNIRNVILETCLMAAEESTWNKESRKWERRA